MTDLCRKPDDTGKFNLHCQHMIDRPRGEDFPRLCLRAAARGSPFCDAHQEAPGPFPRSRRMIADAIDEVIFDAFAA